MIDPTKQAEYPVLLGDRLTGQDVFSHSRLVNLNYNYKTKSATPQQRSTITRSSQSQDIYNLTITDKPPNKENSTLTYLYEGSVDPAQAGQESQVQNYVLVFDSDRKAFVLEPVVTRLNFNLRSAPAKTEKQVLEQYEQLKTLQEDQQVFGDEQAPCSVSEDDDGPADESNPYDFRHFLPKGDDDEKEKLAIDRTTPDPHLSTSKPDTLSVPATAKPAPSPKPRPKTQTNPLRQKKTEPAKKKTEPTKKKEPPPPKSSPKPEAHIEVEEFEELEIKSTPSDTGTAALSSHKAVPSPGSNIIIDGDLIIDMGSPPPSRPFNINPAHFSSNNTPADGPEDDEDEMEDLRLPSPAGHPAAKQEAAPEPAKEEEVEDDDALAAEMEAAFEESAMEEENTHGRYYSQPPSQQYNAHSEDESEVSEEE